MMNSDQNAPLSSRAVTRWDLIGLFGGFTLLAASFTALFVVRTDRYHTPTSLRLRSCSAWTDCPGETVLMDFTSLIKWLILLGVVVALIGPLTRALPRISSHTLVKTHRVAVTLITVAMGVTFALAVWRDRYFGADEWIYQISIRMTWSGIVVILATLVVCGSVWARRR